MGKCFDFSCHHHRLAHNYISLESTAYIFIAEFQKLIDNFGVEPFVSSILN